MGRPRQFQETYYERNRVKIREKARQWHLENVERSNEKRKFWARAHPETIRRNSLKFQWRKEGFLDASPEVFFNLLEAQGGVCAICSNPPKGKANLKWYVRNGAYLGLLCQSCSTKMQGLDDNGWRSGATAFLAKHGHNI